MFNDKNVLITGGTGTVGQELTKQLLAQYSYVNIVIFSRNEVSQVEMSRKFAGKDVSFIIGDIRDKKAINKACKNVDYIFHLSAIKHVPICENQPDEAIKTNVQGSQNVIDAALKNSVKRVVNMSTDKAVNPSSFYGTTKSMAEKLFLSANNNQRGEATTDFINVRSGNVMGSSGSIIPLLISKIKKDNAFSITYPAMTRYFVSVQEIVQLLICVMQKGVTGQTYVPDNRKSFQLGWLGAAMIKLYGNSSTSFKITEPRPGEKQHEQMFLENETVMYIDEYCKTKSIKGIDECSNDCVVNLETLINWIKNNDHSGS